MLLHRRLVLELLNALQAEGYPLGPGKLMQIEEIMRHLPTNAPPEALRSLLSPIFSASPEGQRQFYFLFDAQLHRVRESLEQEELPPVEQEVAKKTETRFRRFFLGIILFAVLFSGFVLDVNTPATWLLNTGVLVVGIITALRLISFGKKRIVFLCFLPFLTYVGFLIKNHLIDEKYIESFSRIERFNIYQGETIKLNIQNPEDTGRLISCSTLKGQISGETKSGSSFNIFPRQGVLSYTAGSNSIPSTVDSIFVEAIYKKRRDTIIFIAYIIENVAPTLSATSSPNNITNVSIPHPRSISDIEIPPDKIARANFYLKYQWPIRIFILLLTGMALFAFTQWNERRRARFVAEIINIDSPPYVWNIEIREIPQIKFEDSFIQIINRLRKRESAGRHQIDIRATVKAVSKLGGQTSLVYRQQTRPPEYLLLIDRFSDNDHRARYFDTLYQELYKAEVPVERFFFNGDPRICFNEKNPSGQFLNELYHKYREARLIVVSDGARLFNPKTGQLASWTKIFYGWRRRAIILPNIPQQLGRSEYILGRLFVLAPTSNQGLDLILEQFESLEKRKNLEGLYRIRDSNPKSFQFKGGLLESFRRADFSEQLIEWICACAVYPLLYWDLTLYLGRFLDNPESPALLSAANIRKLITIPWFVHGKIPENARIKLISHLAEKGLEANIRKAIDDLLCATPLPVEGSVAWEKHHMNFILNKLLLNPESSKNRTLAREFEFYLAAGKQPDFVSFKRLEGNPTSFDKIVPDPLKKFLFKHTSSRFGWHNLTLSFIFLTFASIIIAFTPIKTTFCNGETVAYKNRWLCINTPEDRLLLLEHLTADALEARDYLEVDSLLSEAGRIARSTSPPLDTSELHFNTATRYFNIGAQYFNCINQKQPDCPFLSDSLRIWACEHFKRGDSLYILVSGKQDIKFFNAIGLTCKNDLNTSLTFFTIQGSVEELGTGRPVRGAVLSLKTVDLNNSSIFSQDKAFLYQATTDNSGRYIVERVAANTVLFQITVEAPGYKSESFRIRPQGEMPLIQLIKTTSEIIPSAEQSEYETAVSLNTITAYNNFINEPNRNSKLVNDIINRRDLLIQLERKDFDDAQTVNNAKSWEVFLTNWPDGPSAENAKRQLDLIKNPLKSLENNLVFVSGGPFTMGCENEERDGACDPDEKESRSVQIANFYIGRYEVTQSQWRAVMGSDPPELRFKRCDNCPVEHVSWRDTKAFLERLNSITGKKYRLPSEAEWEFAARGGLLSRNYIYSGSNNPNEVGWYSGSKSSGGRTHPVGKKKPNELGLYDMSGNVWEWCEDDWHDKYKGQGIPKTGSPWISSPRSVSRVLRGGAWDYSYNHLRNSNRNGYDPVSRNYSVGFRLALD